MVRDSESAATVTTSLSYDFGDHDRLTAGMSTAEQVALFKYLEDFQIQSNAARRINSRAMERFAGEIQSQLTACILASKHNLLSLNFLSKPFCRAVLLLSLYLGWMASFNLYSASRFFQIRGKYFKFIFERGSQRVNMSAITPIFCQGSLRCEWQAAFYNVSVLGEERIFSFQQSVQITGWAQLEFGSDQSDGQTIRSDANAELKYLSDIKGISLHRSADGIGWERLKTAWPIHQRSSHHTTVDLRPPVWWILHNIASPLCSAVCCFAACTLGLRCGFRAGANLFALGWLLSSAMHLLSVFGGAPSSVAGSCLLSGIFSVLSFFEYGFLEGCLAVWSAQLTLSLLNARLRPEILPLPNPDEIQTCGLVLLVCAALVWRRLYLEELFSRVQRDQKAFDAAFANIKDDPTLPRLAAACDRIAASLGAPEAIRQPTQSVAQLSDQAAALQIVLDAKAQSWALSSCGSPDLDRQEPSAIKLFALLDGDPARLFDYCAAGVVFEDAGCLTTCLKLIQADPCVRIRRLENGLRVSGEALTGCRVDGPGYRCVADQIAPFGHAQHL